MLHYQKTDAIGWGCIKKKWWLSCVTWPPACEGEAHTNNLNFLLEYLRYVCLPVFTRQRQIMQTAVTTVVQILVKHVLISLKGVKVPAFSLSGSPTPVGLEAASAREDICWLLSLVLVMCMKLSSTLMLRWSLPAWLFVGNKLVWSN